MLASHCCFIRDVWVCVDVSGRVEVEPLGQCLDQQLQFQLCFQPALAGCSTHRGRCI